MLFTFGPWVTIFKWDVDEIDERLLYIATSGAAGIPHLSIGDLMDRKRHRREKKGGKGSGRIRLFPSIPGARIQLIRFLLLNSSPRSAE